MENKNSIFLNRAIPYDYHEFGPADPYGKGGNVFHGVDSTYVFDPKFSCKKNFAISVAIDKKNLKPENVSSFKIIGQLHKIQLFEYNRNFQEIEFKYSYDDFEILKWGECLKFDFEKGGLLRVQLEAKLMDSTVVPVVGESSIYITHDPKHQLPIKNSFFSKLLRRQIKL